MKKYDVAIIGGGPGGCKAATHAAEAGLSVVLFEKDLIGGTCLNRGCIPTKALLHAGGLYSEARGSELFGLCGGTSIGYDFDAVHRRKNQVVETLRQGIEKQLKSGKVTVVRGEALIPAAGKISCAGEMWEASDIILAVGAKPALPPIPGIDNPGVYTSDDLLEGEGKEFSSLIIVGGGVIGVEIATFYLSLGCEVTILEMADHILPSMDKEIAQRLGMMLKKQGASIEIKAKVQEIAGEPGAMTVSYLDKKGKECRVAAEGVLMATGRRAVTEELFTEGAAPETDCGGIVTDSEGRTSIPHLYAIGDVRSGNIQLAHVAESQGTNVAALLAGMKPPVDESLVPSCVYTVPEIASVGMTEEEAKAAGITVKTGKALTGANGKCVIENAGSGYVKIVADDETGIILGAQLVCPRATDMISELALAIHKKMTANELAYVIHPHPTFSEMISAAAKEADK